MTLILALGNVDQCIQISDRQLTDANGNARVLPEGKATVLTLADSRLLCGFAGLARVGRFRFGEWMLEALLEAAQPTHTALPTVEAFTKALTKRFQQADIQRVERRYRGLSVMFTGFRDVLPSPNLIAAMVTNFQNYGSGKDEESWDEFRTTYISSKQGPTEEDEITYVQRIGRWIAMAPEDERIVRNALEQRRPAEKIVELGVNIVRKIAATPEAARAIGTDLSSAVLPFARPPELAEGVIPMVGGYHPKGTSDRWHGVNQVISLPHVQLAVKDPLVKMEDPNPAKPMLVEKVGRNERCPCGSGKKYKRCCAA